MKRIPVALSVLLLVSGCARPGIKDLGSTPASIAYCASSGHHSMSELTTKAQAHCAVHGKDAYLNMVDNCNNRQDYTAAYFRCG